MKELSTQLSPFVVPAKARTHTPRRVLLKELVIPASLNNDRWWLWVPAFAGTTPSVYRL
ncbi:hypothetical protein ACVIWU_003661 [Bradyrhizobium sp. USDA 4509]